MGLYQISGNFQPKELPALSAEAQKLVDSVSATLARYQRTSIDVKPTIQLSENMITELTNKGRLQRQYGKMSTAPNAQYMTWLTLNGLVVVGTETVSDPNSRPTPGIITIQGEY